MKFSHITPANLAKAANPSVTGERVSKISNFSNPQRQQNDPQGETIGFYVDGAANPANFANPSDYTPTISKISDFSNGATLKDAVSSRVRCGECRHSSVPADTDPVFGWRRCELGLLGYFARALHRCEGWER